MRKIFNYLKRYERRRDFMKRLVLFLLVCLLFVNTGITYGAEKLILLSTQFNPVAELQYMNEKVLAGFTKETGIKVEFVPASYADFVNRILAEVKTGKVVTNVIAELHGGFDYLASENVLEDLTNMPKLPKRTFIKTFANYSKIRGITAYVPWTQATYVMAINKEALKYLPAGLTQEDILNGSIKWSYNALLKWAENLKNAKGSPMLGFPIAPGGLFHRFLHGYIYPSYTKTQAKAFSSPEAITIWKYLVKLNDYVHPASTTWSNMSEPLLKGEVLIGWDHTARLTSAVRTKPNDFIIAPCPVGPKGRGYILVIAGLGIPKNAPDKEDTWKLVEYLTRPSTQALILQGTGFFPTVREASTEVTDPGLRLLASGVTKQAGASFGIPVLIPSLGGLGGEFNNIYRMAYERIVLRKEAPEKVLPELGKRLEEIFKEAKVTIQ